MAFRVPGPCTITWNEQPLGVAKAGVRIVPRTGMTPITDDDHGEAPASFIFTGKSCVVELIGLKMDSIKTAAPFVEAILAQNNDAVGKLASAFADVLSITERDDSLWTADLACPTDPSEIMLSSVQELRFPLVFLILPNANGDLFSAVPSYVE